LNLNREVMVVEPAEEQRVRLRNFLARCQAVRAEAGRKAAEELKGFLTRYQAIRAIAVRTEEKFDRLIAPRFSVFNYFQSNELALSRIIADLLNPQGWHGQGPLFLGLFLKALNRNLSKAPPPGNRPLEVAALAETKVFTESATSHLDNTKRRIDILAVNPHWALAVENKPWAGEQEKQVGDYQKQLALKYPDRDQRVMVYLSGDGSKPGTADPAYGEPVVMAYRGVQAADGGGLFLNAWLAEARDRCQVDKVRHFLADFTGWVEKNFQQVAGAAREEKV
jgi:hypothetical protein